MATINEKFQAYLKFLASNSEYGFNRRLSEKTGINEQYLSKIINGKKAGTEDVRRRIVEHLGYGYEEFLTQGQTLLSREKLDARTRNSHQSRRNSKLF